jgi:hypothetical protein
MSQIVQIQSGSYFSVTTATDQALDSIGAQRASFVGSSPYPAQQTFAQWLNPAAFGQPALGTFGTGINNILGPARSLSARVWFVRFVLRRGT